MKDIYKEQEYHGEEIMKAISAAALYRTFYYIPTEFELNSSTAKIISFKVLKNNRAKKGTHIENVHKSMSRRTTVCLVRDNNYTA